MEFELRREKLSLDERDELLVRSIGSIELKKDAGRKEWMLAAISVMNYQLDRPVNFYDIQMHLTDVIKGGYWKQSARHKVSGEQLFPKRTLLPDIDKIIHQTIFDLAGYIETPSGTVVDDNPLIIVLPGLEYEVSEEGLRVLADFIPSEVDV